MPFSGPGPVDPAEICRLIGHSPGEKVCPVCGQTAQYVRVYIAEGRAYTYAFFGQPQLKAGERVLVPANIVNRQAFLSEVLRVLDGPDPGYTGRYKVVERASHE